MAKLQNYKMEFSRGLLINKSYLNKYVRPIKYYYSPQFSIRYGYVASHEMLVSSDEHGNNLRPLLYCQTSGPIHIQLLYSRGPFSFYDERAGKVFFILLDE